MMYYVCDLVVTTLSLTAPKAGNRDENALHRETVLPGVPNLGLHIRGSFGRGFVSSVLGGRMHDLASL